MKQVWIFILFSLLGVLCPLVCGDVKLKSKNDIALAFSQQSAVEGLISRLLPEYVDNFAIEVNFSMKSDNKDVFIVSIQKILVFNLILFWGLFY